LREEFAEIACLDLDTAYLAIELADDVVQIGAIIVGRNSSARVREVLSEVDGGAAAVA
jgi:hypothetical protein